MKNFVSVFFLLGAVLAGYGQDVEVGKWRSHFAPGRVSDMAESDNRIYGLSGTVLYYFDTRDRMFSSLDRTKGLSGTGLTAMAYNPVRDVLVLAYSDGKIDLLGNAGVVSITDVSEKDYGTGKGIHAVFTEGRYAYLATDFGLVVLDLMKEEVRETYFFLENGSYRSVSDVLVHEGVFYSIVDNCLFYASTDNPALNDFSSWHSDTCLGNGTLLQLESLWGKVLLVSERNLYWGSVEDGWEILDLPLDGKSRIFARGDERNLIIGTYDSVSGDCGVKVWNADRAAVLSYQGKKSEMLTTALCDASGHLWTGSEKGCLTEVSMTDGIRKGRYCPNGPSYDVPYALSYNGHSVVACRGGFDASFVPVWLPFEFSCFSDNRWENFNAESCPALADRNSASFAVEDPLAEGHFFAASAILGLVEIGQDGEVLFYDPSNSPLELDNQIRTSCRLTSLAFDASGDLWILNTLADRSMHVLHRDGSWNSYDLRVSGNSTDRISDLMVDYWQHKWVIFNKSSVSVYATDGDRVEGLQVNMNYGNDLQTSKVYCMVEDALGHVWFGTDRGVKIIDQHAKMFDSPNGNYTSVPVKTVKVPRDGYLMELLKDDQVTAIAVDGGNRKWLGTASGGLYLVSSDGMEELAHFTEENSPLLSNAISSLALDEKTGELFITCAKGLVSYRGTSTTTENFEKSAVRVYPNPVRPSYTGYINIKGLPNNALVKITDTKGNLIYQARAAGGQLSWDGFSLQGRKPDSGVLFVFASDDDKSQKLACKIFFVR